MTDAVTDVTLRPRLHVGLTGGIAAGKSAVAAELERCGALLVDSDALARLVLEPGTEGLAAVQDAFGDRVIAADGSLDRAALAQIVFADPAARQRLNGIVHPRVRRMAREIVAQAGPDAVVVQDVPLLVETGQADAFDLVIVVEAPAEERIRRMVEDRGMTREDALARMAAQATDEERAAVADVVIVNDGDLDRLREITRRVWEGMAA
ncbi:dephospho-CoA kinase [Micrococcus sp. ACRRV]|uniref:dephospho-CoA kinase n=1 Tax=Micrococcus sp. ACRRV TaxID=2918203 RepID=UPI001EF3C7BB|nr:dephospho-CoA kinase [Micrococcus sp. ACRRV]MCG7421702.1 dephospho-CoA kinase [Micrococcus sp. ACRRV]